ncbi:carbohydrate ABC transporter permease [Pseudobutyrivibrio xylanivorans]|uniref:Maltose/maltodextrin transport system permease protein n=1 Tax=Pseudobutyrivibrio xylanivorans DSM 14809 TaxID=1123012 RepID=A0A1M6AR63_PSEXY|nr:sugar ABC transporter permease [Pseudobutyrivibrio xylanivorans]SHI38956.1 arabinogalactan oligomer / maltooligosaccharide transport system permease protein [Pseudobutyrivibrio xylanivorans DSM 14809]
MNKELYTKLSYVVWGLLNIIHGQIVKGLIFLSLEISYILFMIISGARNLAQLITLGDKLQGMNFNEEIGIYEMTAGDNSMLILLYGVITIVISIVALSIGFFSVSSGKAARERAMAGKHNNNFLEDLRSLTNNNIRFLLLSVPVVGLIVFTVMPLLYMILMAFTNYDQNHQPPGNLFDWVGIKNFITLLSTGDRLASTFWPVLGWTLIWGFAATFTCYFGGMILAMIINSQGIRFKKFWRTIFVFTMAIPGFISLRVVATMLGEKGIFNVLLQQWGFTSASLPFLSNATWARFSVIIVNFWIGVPVTMLMVSGILMNIPGELYEAARIDGAGPVTMFRKITFPYMWFVTTPYLISNLISNFNNFNTIYFLTAGEPHTLDYYKGAGKTDLLVTWLYKLTKDSNDFNLAATIGIIIFVISAIFTLISFSRSNSLKNEEGFS